MTDIAGLLEQVRAATGPDRELDAALDCHFRFTDTRPAHPDDFDGRFGYSPGDIKVEHGFLQAQRYTASVDAAIALVERKLPGWMVDHIGADGAGVQGQIKIFGWHCELTDGVENHAGDAPTLPLAILSALLSALFSGDAS